MRRPGRRGVRRSRCRTPRRAIGALAFAFTLLACTTVARADWNALGDTVNPGPPFVGTGAVAADAGGTAYVAWLEYAAEGQRILVGRWTGSAWQVVGQPFDGAPVFGLPSIISAGGVPYVAFIENSPADDFRGQVRVWRLNATGDGWVAVDGGSLNHDPVSGDAKDLSIATVGSVVHVAFTEVGGSATTLWVKKLQGSSWVTVGDQLNVSPTTALRPHIADVGGAPCVVWISADSVGGMDALNGLRVSRFSGASWVVLGGKVRDGLGSVGHLTDVGGAPAVLLRAETEDSYVVRRWDGTSWGDLGDPLNGPDDPLVEEAFNSGSIATIGGSPYVAYTSIAEESPRIRVLRYDGTAWTQVGSGLNRSAGVYPSYPVIASVGGDALVVWHEAEAIHASQIDTAPPIDTLITGTSTATNAGVAIYSFTATPSAGATFECSYDDAPFALCTSPNTSGVLSPGAHTFRVRATNAGGTDPTPARRDFIVDRVSPTTAIRLDGTRVPSGAFAGSVTVEADVTDPALSSGIRNKFCVVDPPTPPTSFGAFGSQPCGVVVTALGSHTAYAIANDQAGNASAIVSTTFLIAAAPDTIITEGPSGLVSSLPVRWAYRTTIPGSTFECRMDSGAYEACDATYSTLFLDEGPHTFSVRAVGPTGVVDPTPDTRTITLGPKRINGTCSGPFPFGDPFRLDGNFSLGGADCVALEETCPAGSTCTVTLTVGATDADTRTPWNSFGDITIREQGKDRGGRRTDCFSTVDELPPDPIFEPYRHPCNRQTTLTMLGPIDVKADCYVERSIYGSGYHGRGPDNLRILTCAATMDITPIKVLGVTVTGKKGATTVPGPGVLAITGALGGVQSAAAPAAAIQAVTVPAPAFKMKKKVKATGVVRFPLGLRGEAKRIYDAGGVVELELTTTFTAADGTSTITQEVITLQRDEKPPRQRKRGGPLRCRIFPDMCP
jgi:hypothetical protein